MSVLCQNQTFCRSFDHLIGASEQRWRHGETEHPGRLGVDHQLELGRLHHRQVRGLCALGHAAGEDTELTVRIRQAGGWGER